MYRWKSVAFVAIVIAILASTARAQSCHEAQQQDLLCFTPLNTVHHSTSGSPAAPFWGSTTREEVPLPALPENAGIVARTDAWGKTTYYNLYGQAIGTSTVDVAGNVHFRDRNGSEVDNLW